MGYSLKKVFETAERAVRAVGLELKAATTTRRENAVHYKGPIDIFTDLDLWAEAELTKLLQAALPDSIVVSEESSRDLILESGNSLQELIKAEHTWVVDPIDGTNNFCNHVPHFAISVALLERGTTRLGIVYDPMRDELFSALEHEATTLNGQLCSPSQKTALCEALVAIPLPVSQNRLLPFWENIANVATRCRASRITGCATLDICWVASGRFDTAILHSIQPWDVAAAALIARQAGTVCANVQANVPVNFPADQAFDMFSESFIFCGVTLREELFNALSSLPFSPP